MVKWVKAILTGNKTQTRRIIKPQPNDYINRLQLMKNFRNAPPYRLEDDDGYFCGLGFQDDNGNFWRVPYGQCGHRLWVIETFSAHGDFGVDGRIVYRADCPDGKEPHGLKWKPSIFMPRQGEPNHACDHGDSM